MLRLSIREAMPGMRLALAVYHPRRPGTVLLKGGVRLDERLIARLREIEAQEIWIRYPGMEFLGRYVSPGVLQARAGLTHHVMAALDAAAADAMARLNYAEYKRAIVYLVEQLVRSPAAAYYVAEMCAPGTPLGRHAGSVCFLSLLMGLKLGDYLIAERSRLSAAHARDVTALGVGAMLHDVGMLRLSEQTLKRWNETHDQADPHWRRHVRLGFEMVRQSVDPSAAVIVLHHHQAYDGSGFPRRRAPGGTMIPLRGRDIHVFARIVAAADAFDRLRDPADAPGADALPQQRLPTVAALREVALGPTSQRLDPMVVRALVSCVPAYAPGSVVELTTGQRAVVCDWRPEDPCRPRVLPIDDLGPALDAGPERIGVLDSFELPEGVIDLALTPGVRVARAEGHDVLEENFLPPFEGAFDVARADRERINGAVALKAPGESTAADRDRVSSPGSARVG